jgi:hypothetical protein
MLVSIAYFHNHSQHEPEKCVENDITKEWCHVSIRENISKGNRLNSRYREFLTLMTGEYNKNLQLEGVDRFPR